MLKNFLSHIFLNTERFKILKLSNILKLPIILQFLTSAYYGMLNMTTIVIQFYYDNASLNSINDEGKYKSII